MVKSRKSYLSIEEVERLFSQREILDYYFGITDLPILINSPLREDKHPSFSIYSPDNNRVNYIDFSTKENGTIYGLLRKLWNLSFVDTLHKICEDLNFKKPIYNRIATSNYKKYKSSHNFVIKCKIRDWEPYDIEYWESYGVPLSFLKMAEVYPISHKIIVKDGKEYVFGADKLAYAFVERKENKITLKIYQPYNTNGFKWSNNHDSSVISLWGKLPKSGDKIVICASLKDALCLWANTGIPTIALQGEGYTISDTAIKELKKRFQGIYICFDNDKAGIMNASRLATQTGFINVQLPPFDGGKDISDFYKVTEKNTFTEVISNLFN